ncbi:hypothetical protein [Chryseobacterium indologenes]|uniref:hypothetical protein n=1 Tax=Chryseobacterium indologenes TaxID=253 RepID=UPI003D351737
MKKILLIVFAILAGFFQAQTKKQTTTKQKTEKKWVNPVKLTKEERNRPYMDEVLKTRDSLTPTEAERRRKNIAIGNPFAKYGVYPKIATLSKGKYLEFHDMDSVVSIGSVRFNRKTKSITEFREIDLSDPDAQPYLDTAGRWISPDPLSEEFSSWSPYHIGYNNPISNIDPDGRAAFDWVKDGNRIFFDPAVTGNSQVQAKYGENAQSIEGYNVTKNGITTSYGLGQDGSISTNFANILSTNTSVYQTGNIETGAATIEGQLGSPVGYIRATPDNPFANPSSQLAYNGLVAFQMAGSAIAAEGLLGAVGLSGGLSLSTTGSATGATMEGMGVQTSLNVVSRNSFEIGEGVRRVHIMKSLGYNYVNATNETGQITKVAIEDLYSPMKSSIPHDARYENLYKSIQSNGQTSPIYIQPGARGIPASQIKLTP